MGGRNEGCGVCVESAVNDVTLHVAAADSRHRLAANATVGSRLRYDVIGDVTVRRGSVAGAQ